MNPFNVIETQLKLKNSLLKKIDYFIQILDMMYLYT